MNKELDKLERDIEIENNTNLIIDDKIIYKLYIEDIEFELNNIKKDLVTYKGILNNLTKVINKNKTLINNRTSTTVDKILSSTTESIVSSIDFYNLEEDTVKALTMYFRNYIKTNKVIKYQEKKIELLNSKITPYKIFTKVIKKFNKRIIEECINNQYVFELGYNIGFFRIVYNISNKLTPNWGASTRKKKEILERGGKLYNGKEAEEYRERGEEYDGEMYLVFKDRFSLWFEWNIPPISIKYNNILMDYKFKPARGNYGSMSLLGELKKKFEVDKNEAMRLFPLAKSKIEK